MKAVIYNHYGAPDVLQFDEVDEPVAGVGEVLVKVHAATVNRTDCANLRAKPFFMRLVTGLLRPKKRIPGTEFAGEIIATGSGVDSLQPGDRVFGFDDEGACAQAQMLAIADDKVVSIPDDISYAQAAASSEGAHYAINFINKIDLEAGQKVLVNGATGAIGSAAVQLLKHYGAEVTAVCAAEHSALVLSLGAGRVIDYTTEDFTGDGEKFHYVFDTVGKSSFFKCWKLLLPGGIYISSDLGYLWQNILLPMVTVLIKSLIGNKKTASPIPFNIKRSLLLIRDLMQQGRFRAVLDKSFPLHRIVEAYRYVEGGQKIGNVVIAVDRANKAPGSEEPR